MPAGRAAACGPPAATGRRGSGKAAREASPSPCTSSCAPIRWQGERSTRSRSRNREDNTMERKLAAIFSTDVKGYSRLMGEDEIATIHTITAYRALIATLIQQHRGRVVDSPGDNLLAEFPSVVEAVQCAVAIQHELRVRKAALPLQRRMQFRIGINLGDVIVEGERIYGDGVNIAARLESLAEAGGICISGMVYDQVETKLAFNYESLGEQAVKNIAQPVRVYRVRMDEMATSAGEALVLRPFGAAQDRQAQHERIPTPVALSPSRAYSVEGRTPEHRPREAQRAACRSAAARRAVASRWRPPARSLRGRSGL